MIGKPTIAALYIDPLGPYPKLEGVECWDETRDARLYPGPWPVVAHPPCGNWSSLRHLYNHDTRDCALIAAQQVRAHGGVLEHPAYSRLWLTALLPAPDAPPDALGGFSIEVCQCAWGHVARKCTWLYCVGVPRELVHAGIRSGGTPTHWVSGSRTAKRGAVPAGIKVCSAEQRRKTPRAFAEWLVSLARAVEPLEMAA